MAYWPQLDIAVKQSYLVCHVCNWIQLRLTSLSTVKGQNICPFIHVLCVRVAVADSKLYISAPVTAARKIGRTSKVPVDENYWNIQLQVDLFISTEVRKKKILKLWDDFEKFHKMLILCINAVDRTPVHSRTSLRRHTRTHIYS